MPASDRPPSCALKSIRLAHVAIACAILLSAAATVRVATHHGSNPDAGEAVPQPRPAGAFYRPPSPLPPAPPGTLIRSEPVPGLPTGVRGWRILYHSRSVAGGDIAVSGVVVEPTSTSPAAGRHVIAWAHGTTGSGDSCAPSTDLNPIRGIEDGPALLAAGYAIVATDYEGLGTPGPHPYLVAASEARSVLDAVRAAHGLPTAGIGTSFIAYGHSQGGQAVLETGQIAATYAPDLTLLAVAAASPPTDLTALARSLTHLDYGTAYLLAAAAGYSAAHPSADLSTILTPLGKADGRLIEDACNDQLVTQMTGTSAGQIFTHDPRTTPPWSTGFIQDSTGNSPITVPVLIIQGQDDPIVNVDVTSTAVTHICILHDSVQYRIYRNTQHNVVPTAARDLNRWLADRFRDIPNESTCPV